MLRWNLWRTRTGLTSSILACSRRLSTDSKPCFASGKLHSTHPQLPDIKRHYLSTVSEAPLNDTASDRDSFKYLLDNSRFVQSIDPVGKVAEAVVIALSGENMYVDFGGKFHAVVPLPNENRNSYVEGTKVRVKIKDLELTDHFLGAKKHISLLEADAELVGLAERTT